jgi:hypothetical protein
MPTTVLLFLIPIWPTGYHLPLVMNGAKVTGEAPHVWVPAFFPLVTGLYWSWSMSWTHKHAVAAMPTTICCSLFLFDPQAIICHWWEIKSKWPKKHMYGYKQYVQWCSWSLLIIIHVLNSQICACCNVHHCFAVACSYLTHQRAAFATGD